MRLSGANLVRLGQAGLDLFFPRPCAGCGGVCDRDGRHVCWQCLGELDFLRAPVCERCGIQPEGFVSNAFVCGRCRHEPPAFDLARAATRFSGPMREWLHAFKYNGASWLCGDLTDVLLGCVQSYAGTKRFDGVTSVPLHGGRQRRRGYNQSAMLGRALARRLGLPWRMLLVRVRATPTQTRLNASDRRSNVRGAFQARSPEWIAERSWLLVDDIITTGATLSEVARTLRDHGALDVWAFTVARG